MAFICHGFFCIINSLKDLEILKKIKLTSTKKAKLKP